MSQSVDTLPALDDYYTLTDEQIHNYQQNGHILLPGVAGADEVAAYREHLGRIVENHRHTVAPLDQRDTYGKAFLQIGNLWQKDPAAAKFVLAKRFAKIAADLMGVDGVRLYHDQALYKEGGGGHTPWHQDQFYWPLDTNNTITMWMPLVDADEQMGTMRFASGSHMLGYLGELPISDASEEHFNRFVAEQGFTRTEGPAMTAGDATFHCGWTLHSAPGNNTDRMREVMTIIYFADGTKVSTPDNANRQNDLETWLPGCVPGDLAASELNPLLFSRW